MRYISHFGQNSEAYLNYRPNYPEALFAYLANLTPGGQVWDCGTGNGQAALSLAKYFNYIIGTDINLGQLQVGIKVKNLVYANCLAESSCLGSQSMDLITVAQAIHWFPLDKFYQEVRRVGKEHAMLAVWCYSLAKIHEDLDQLVTYLYTEILGDTYWPKERKYIDEEYKTLDFPFLKSPVPEFIIEKSLTFKEFIGYLNTWSAVKEYIVRNQQNPVDLILEKLQLAWGNVEQTLLVRWPLHLLVGKIHAARGL